MPKCCWLFCPLKKQLKSQKQFTLIMFTDLLYFSNNLQ